MALYYIAYELHDSDLDDYCSMDEALEQLGANKVMQFLWVIQIPGSQATLFETIWKYLPSSTHDKLMVLKPSEVCTSQALDDMPGKRLIQPTASP
ncbi:hypothetical protein KCM76_20865 [Zooshikella marina]|uniref:hypothetical protein n=1 Tax=Zooshikella ganghwensis TaxID=202772 RepID=UPI001BAE5D3C|nr:hypothetical protein [Zooshikella ganghwensis]MBU2708458.1 hypothetical protein [Zooshikella ganghwensis]